MKHDYRAVLDKFGSVEGLSLEERETIESALRIAEKLMEEPSLEMLNEAKWPREVCGHIFKAMRDQMLKEIEQ